MKAGANRRWPTIETGDWDEAFVWFYRFQYPQAVRVAWLLTRTASDAEDLAQDAFLALEPRFSELHNPEAYLRSVLVNRCRRWRARRRMGTERLVRFAVLEGSGSRTEPDDEMLLDIVGDLPYRQRVVLVARYWAAWSEAEIAEALKCQPGTVKSLAARALAELRSRLSDRDQEVQS